MSWTSIAVDGDPASDLSGNVSVYEVYDGYTVHLVGRFNDIWTVSKDGPVTPTHWSLWFGADPPPAPGWTPIAAFVPPETRIEFVEVYDGDTTSFTVYSMTAGGWLYEVPGVTHWKYPTLSDPPV